MSAQRFQFSMRRLFAATTLIAGGYAAFADLATSASRAPPMSRLNAIECLVSFPLIGAGLFTLIKRPILGACLGFFAFWVFFYLWAKFSGG
jgi:hypothetical protein